MPFQRLDVLEFLGRPALRALDGPLASDGESTLGHALCHEVPRWMCQVVCRLVMCIGRRHPLAIPLRPVPW